MGDTAGGHRLTVAEPVCACQLYADHTVMTTFLAHSLCPEVKVLNLTVGEGEGYGD